MGSVIALLLAQSLMGLGPNEDALTVENALRLASQAVAANKADERTECVNKGLAALYYAKVKTPGMKKDTVFLIYLGMLSSDISDERKIGICHMAGRLEISSETRDVAIVMIKEYVNYLKDNDKTEFPKQHSGAASGGFVTNYQEAKQVLRNLQDMQKSK